MLWGCRNRRPQSNKDTMLRPPEAVPITGAAPHTALAPQHTTHQPVALTEGPRRPAMSPPRGSGREAGPAPSKWVTGSQVVE